MIQLVTDGQEPHGWYFAVWSPEPKEERGDLETRLQSRLATGRSTKYQAWLERVEQYRNWYSLVPDLQEENQAHKKGQKVGQITGYFVNRFIDIAEKAVPIIDEFETGSKA